MPTAMSSHQFSKVPTAEIQRSQFDRSHAIKTTFDAGLLIPFFVDEALPGDTFNLRMNAFARLATPLKPVMDNLWLETFFFAVPLRIVWANFVKMMGEQTNPGDSISYTVPITTVPGSNYSAGTIQDYMGLPVGVNGYTHSALYRRAYYRIYNEWFRDENIISSVVAGLETGDGPDVVSSGALPAPRGKRHDYFTSCLPWPQKGNTAVTLPLGTTAPIVASGTEIPKFKSGGAGSADFASLMAKTAVGGPDVKVQGTGTWAAGESLKWSAPELEADLSTATSATINDLREAFQIQKLLERDARGGTRYTEIIKSHFGVTSPDARLQRPEYLGGGKTPVMVTPIAQNSATASEPTPIGNLSGVGTANAMGHGFVKSFTEHCIIMGIVCVRADLTYQQGLERMWSRSTRYDFYWPAFAHLGEQAVLNKEIYTQGSAGGSDDDDTFGYQERYAEYKYKPSRITGKFRSTVAGTLDIWHLSQEFSALPTLNSTFIEEAPPVDRVIAVPTEPHFLFDSFLDYKCARPMPVYSVPGLIDHF